jgi:hypothetical protein
MPQGTPTTASRQEPSLVRQILKGALILLSPLGILALLRLVFWILVNPHIFLLTWCTGLAVGKAAEYVVDNWNTVNGDGDHEHVLVGTSTNVQTASNGFQGISAGPSSATQRRTLRITEAEAIFSSSISPDDSSLAQRDNGSSDRNENGNLTPTTTRLLQSAAPGVAGFNSKIPKLKTKLGELMESALSDAASSGEQPTNITGVTESFLNRNVNSFPEMEWGAIVSGIPKGVGVKLEILHPDPQIEQD